LPDGLRVYAVGDIHGRFDLLEALYGQIRRDLQEDAPTRSAEIFLGDYLDRGEQSCQVVEWMISASPLATSASASSATTRTCSAGPR
jgi:serine/threonine protein phosphatase 1